LLAGVQKEKDKCVPMLALPMCNRSAIHLGVIVFSGRNRRALTRRESCTLWYDGRR
jgi:hypothetical protein